MFQSTVFLFRFVLVSILIGGLVACGDQASKHYDAGADSRGHTVPTAATIAANARVAEALNLDDPVDFQQANRGLIAKPENLLVEGDGDEAIWRMADYNFMEGNAPGSVNPSLWRQARLNNIHGLFELVPGVYQLRGFDLANMTLIEAENSWIVVDPLTSKETAAVAFEFAMQHLPKKPVSTILLTHSHIDHFGGIEGILGPLSDAEREKIKIVAPEGFLEEATSENLIAGPAMSRRAMFMYGKRLDRSERGHVGSGLGKGPAFGTFGIAEPTDWIDETPTERVYDGVRFVFQYTPSSEAPAEFTFYLPEHKAFCGAEVVSRNLHNLYTLRGAKVRDALKWSAYIAEAQDIFAEADVYFGSHHWPVWGKDKVQAFLANQRDVYKYIHDQSVRMMNAGLTPNEIAAEMKLPENLSNDFSTRGYYGTPQHNAKAVYQNYMGWFTANPAMLNPIPEAESAPRVIELMGGADQVVQSALAQFEKVTDASPESVQFEYRWLAQLLNWVVFADPEHLPARTLLAKVYDQLGYLSESGPWRDFYLTGAYELRHGGPDEGINPAVMREVLMFAPVERFFDSMAVNLKGPEAAGEDLQLAILFTDLEEQYLLTLRNSVLHHRPLSIGEPVTADTTLRITHPLFIDMMVGRAGLKETLFSDQLEVEGSVLNLVSFFSLFEKQEGRFNIVEP